MLVGDANDPYWGQVLEGMYQAAQALGVTLVDLKENLPSEPSVEEEAALLEELLALKIKLLLDWGMPNNVAWRLLEAGATIVHLVETDIKHPRCFSPVGLYDAAHMAGEYLAQVNRPGGEIILVGGLGSSRRSETGRSRIQGFLDALRPHPQIPIRHIPTGWTHASGYEAVLKSLTQSTSPVGAIFGISDTLAAAARDAAQALHCLVPGAPVVGINGDPFALAAIAVGSMTATIETSGIDLGRDAVQVAFDLASGKSTLSHYPYRLRLVTAQNVHQVSAEKLIAIAELPNRLVGFNRKIQQERLVQLETSLEINRRVGAILDLNQLSHEIAELIRTNYGYDEVSLYRWLSDPGVLALESGGQNNVSLPLEEETAFSETIRRDSPLFIPATPAQINSRLLLPIHFSGTITHLLDLRSSGSMFHTRQDLIGLQSLADQFGIAIRNAELYAEAVRAQDEALAAKARAEKADQLKTRLLANVSHELRTPLNIIIGYSQSAIAKPNPYKTELPEKLLTDIGYIYDSGEHLLRLINDLLDLSRAEIDELDLFTEAVDPLGLIEDAFCSMADTPTNEKAVTWRLELPDRLPMLNADPVRLKQILLNLLSNARKFTHQGEIVLGADIVLPYLHVWVKDTGEGISMEDQERIFEPFFTAQTAGHRREGIGLGLTVTRRLITLHGGSLSLESQPGIGSTFHMYLPLPNLVDEPLPATLNLDAQPVAVIVSQSDRVSPALVNLCTRQGLQPYVLNSIEDLNQALKSGRPELIAWDTRQPGPRDWALIQKLRSHPQICHLPFLLAGGDINNDQGEDAGFTDVLLKPIQSSSLIKLIDSFRLEQAQGEILIVDDDKSARDLVKSILDAHLPGYSTICLAGGAEAQAYLSKASPGLVILDLMMPGVDGFQVLEYIRSQTRTAQTPVLVMSGQVLSYEDVKRLNYDRVFYQSKNILSLEETAERLLQVLGGGETLPQTTSKLVKQALAFLHQNYDRSFTLLEITNTLGVSKSYLSQIFRDEMGLSLWEYLNRFRVEKARQLLRATSLSITEIAMRVGFEDFSYFGRVFHKYCACSPRAFRQQAQSH